MRVDKTTFWYFAPIAVILVLFIVSTLVANRAQYQSASRITEQLQLNRSVARNNHNLLCLQVANLSHTPTVAQMRAVHCDPKLLPTSAP
jgi:cation transport ATPase